MALFSELYTLGEFVIARFGTNRGNLLATL